MRMFEKSDLFYAAVFIVATIVVAPWSYIKANEADITYSQAVSDVNGGKVSSAIFRGQQVYLTEKGVIHKALLPSGSTLADTAVKAGLPVTVKPEISVLTVLIVSVVTQIVATLGILFIWRNCQPEGR